MLWFRFPDGARSISINQQIFEPEYVNPKGIGYFRAPEIFKTVILSNPGFEEEIPEVKNPEKVNESQRFAILQAQIDSLKSENQKLQAKLNVSERNLEIANKKIIDLTVALNKASAR